MPQTNQLRPTRTLQFTLLGLTSLLAACGTVGPQPGPESSEVQADQQILTPLALPADAHPIKGSTASSATSDSKASRYSWDDQLSTWWSASSLGSWVRYDLGSEKTIDSISLAFYRGANRKATFDVELSRDGSNWTKVLSKVTSSGSTTNLERYNVSDQSARYIRVTNHGNTENSAIAITEAVVHGVGSTSSSGDTTTSTGRTYYVDCSNGSDSNSGTSTGSAWRSVGKVNNSWLNAGERLLLKRGCTWNGPLNARWNGTSSAPIVIGAYGEGDLPRLYGGNPGAVAITGTHQIIENLQVTADKPAPYKYAVKCKTTPMGWRIGFAFTNGARHNTVRHSKAYGLTGGVHLAVGATYNKVLNNTLTNNTTMSSNTNDPALDNSGAWGVLINGDHNEVAYNYFSGNSACSEKYTIEGASLEVFRASNNYFHHNTSINDTTFTEMGGKPDDRAENNVYAYNLFASLNTPYKTGEMLVIRGWKSYWGANPGTKFYNNTAFNVNVGIYCGEGCDSSILSARNNIIVMRSDATKAALWTDGNIDEGNNIYWRNGGGNPGVTRPGGVSSSSRITEPRFVDAWGRNFDLRSDSPAVNKGVYAPVQNLGIRLDLKNRNNFVGGALDLGALERQ